MDNTANTDKTKGTYTVSSLEEFTERISNETQNKKGGFLYRGQCNAEWKVESGAYRRLENKKQENVPTQNKILNYIEDIINKAKQYPQDIKTEASDLQILGKLQHHHAATNLIDFTTNALVALYFACEEHKDKTGEYTAGKVFCTEVDNSRWKEINNKNLQDPIREIIERQKESQQIRRQKDSRQEIKASEILQGRSPVGDGSIKEINNKTVQDTMREVIGRQQEKKADSSTEEPKIWMWKPPLYEGRIIKQDSVFIFTRSGRLDVEWRKVAASQSGTSANNFTIIIPHDKKKNIRTALDTTCGINETSLFPDFHGFTKNQGTDNPYEGVDVDDYMKQGDMHFRQGQYAEAIEDYNKAIELDPNYTPGYNNRGLAKTNLEQYQEAIKDFDSAIQRDPNYVAAYFNRAIAKARLGQLTEAIEDFTKAIELDPNFAAGYNNRANAKQRLGQLTEAIEDYNKAIELDPNLVTSYNNRGLAKTKLEQYQEAIENWNKTIELDPNFAAGYCNRGIAKAMLEQYAEAIEDYNKAIELDPNSAHAYFIRGVAKAELKQYSGAIEDYSMAIEIDPNYARTYNSRAFSRAELGKHSEAIEDLTKAIEIDPNDADGYNNRAFSRAELGKYEEAIEDLTKAIEIDLNFAAGYNSRANAKAKLGQYTEAIEDYNKAIELDPNNAAGYAGRALAQAQLGQHPEALEDWKQAKKLCEQQGDTEIAETIQNIIDDISDKS